MKINIKKLNKSLITLLLIFTFFAISTYPSSNSKYYLESKASDELNYSVNTLKVKQVDDNNIGYHPSQSDDKTLYFSFNFDRNTLLLPGEKDIYTIKVNDGCYITSVDGDKKTANQTQILEFNDNNVKNGIEVKYYCNINSSSLVNGKYTTNVKIYEQFNTTASHSYLIQSKKLPNIVPPEEEKDYYFYPNNDPDNDMVLYIKKDYEYLEKRLKENLLQREYESLTYFNEVYDSVEKMKTDQGLKGLTVTTSSDDKYYIYTVDNTYKSYAATRRYNNGQYYFLDDPSKSSDDLTLEQVNEMFDNYLGSDDRFTSQQKSDIETYIKNNKYNGNDGSIYYVIYNSKSINGITYYSDYQSVSLKNILYFVYPQEECIIGYTETNRPGTYINYINSLTNVSDSLKTEILSNSAIKLSLTKPSTTSKKDYYYFEKDGEKLFVIVDFDSTNSTITISVELLLSNTNYNLEFYTSDISETDISKVTNVLNNIDSNLTKKVDNNSVESDITYNDLISDTNTPMTYTTPNGINVTIIKSGNKFNVRFNNTPIVGASYSMAPTFANNNIQSVSSNIDRTTITEEVIEDSNDNIEEEQEVDESSESDEEDEDKSKVVSSDDDEDDDSGVTQENNDDITEDGISGNANDGPENVGSDIANNGNSIDINPDAPLDNST